MSNILLESLEIENFRSFRHLKINQLGRVNLIVGKNNVGKTSLLEALSIYAHRGSPSWIWDILEARDETSRVFRGSIQNDDEDRIQIEDFKCLFYGRKILKEQENVIKIGSGKSDNTLSIGIGWYIIESEGKVSRKLPPVSSTELSSVEKFVPGLALQFGKVIDTFYRLNNTHYFDRQTRIPELEPTGIKCFYIPSNGLNHILIEECWDNIALTSYQQHVIDSLRIIEPGVDGLNFIKDKKRRPAGPYEPQRIPVIRMAGFEDRLALGSLGEGMNRILGISLALSNAAEGVLLINEIESGLHYSVQADMWRVVLQMAWKLNVQVFATTHSWDCIEGFQKAIQKENRKEGYLIRLGRKKEDIVATVYDETELAVITRDQIEVR